MESEGLKVFVKSVGNAVYSLNTICVGLDAVSKGNVEKPDDLTISWESNDYKQSAISARSFAVRSALVFVEEALLEYFKYISNCPDQPAKILSAVTTDGVAKKIEKLSSQISNLEPYWAPIVTLLVRWRNQVVHNSNISLSPAFRKILIDNSGIINQRHAAIDISQTLSNFDSRKITLKDFTTMIAVTIRYVRQLDAELSPNIKSTEFLLNQLVSRDLVADYKNVIGVNGLDKQKKKFDGFIKSNFPSLIGAQSDTLFESRFDILENK